MGKDSPVYTFLLTLQEVILIPEKADSNPVLVLMLLLCTADAGSEP